MTECLVACHAAPNVVVQVFKTMADFLTSNPSEVLVIGLSNINCGDKDAARQQLLGILAASSLLKFAALQVGMGAVSSTASPTLFLGLWDARKPPQQPGTCLGTTLSMTSVHLVCC